GVIDYTAAPEMTIRARYYKADEFFEIHGSRGIIWVTRGTGEMLDMPAVVLIRGGETVSYQVPADWRLGFDGAAADFIDSLLAGRQPAQDIRTAKHILQVPLAIYRAAHGARAREGGALEDDDRDLAALRRVPAADRARDPGRDPRAHLVDIHKRASAGGAPAPRRPAARTAARCPAVDTRGVIIEDA